MKPFKLFAITLALFIFSPLNLSAADGMLTENSVIGTVSGKEILLSDIEDQKINELRIQLHDALQEAFVRHAVKQLSDSSDDYKPAPRATISDEQIETFYLKNNLQSRGSFEQLSPMIREYMEGMDKARSEIDIYQRASNKGDIVSLLKKPVEMLLKLPVETAFLRGNEKARIMVMEFSDYQCPFCKRAQSTVKSLMEQYGDRVAFGYRHFPLAFHKEADEAANAAECARDQGGFEAMHEKLFNQSDNLHPDALKSIAKQIALKDLEQFNSCLDNNTYGARISRDMAVAQSVGITGTPGFIIGYHNPQDGTLEGELISGAQPANVFVAAIEKYIKNPK
ncbi:MAG: thioredoxin domain-containing protein [Sedimenticola sp.]|nr:thioredoxin domain-containing protein [Sedimenticola sp.]